MQANNDVAWEDTSIELVPVLVVAGKQFAAACCEDNAKDYE